MRILLIGTGPMPAPGTRTTGFAQLRLQAFDGVLRGAGHEVLRVELEESPGWLDRLESLGADCEVVVSAGPYAPGRAACLVAGERPVWADLPGDPMAELHAQSLHGPVPPDRLAAALEHALLVLDRADAISVISERQRLATIGALGSRGRLLGPQATTLVATLPITWPGPSAPPRTRTLDEPLRVLWMGALNAWFDEETAIAGLDGALAADPRVGVEVCGGPHPAHPPQAWARVEAWAARHPDRVQLHGWLPQAQLEEVLARGHVGICLDRPGLEPLLGSRTRVLGFLQAGLPVLATAGTELVDSLTEAGHLATIDPGDPGSLTRQLLELADRPEDGARVLAAQTWAEARYAAEGALAPLLDWLEAPARVAPAPGERAVLSRQLEDVRQALAEVHHSPTWRILSRLRRLLSRGP